MGREDNLADEVQPTKEEWEAFERAYAEAPEVPLSPDRIKEIVNYATGDRYVECPLKAAGFHLESFIELGSRVIGRDGWCICTASDKCPNVDKRTGERCSLEDLRRLDREAVSRRAWQSGE